MTENQLLLNACNLIAEYIKEEFIKQGHSLTEEWENSVITREEDGGAAIYGTAYGLIVDAGISPDRIPFGGAGTGAGGEISQYILGLQRFWKLRRPGISDKQALKLAFATANVQKEEGMSTVASDVYSNTGERQHFMEAVRILIDSKVDPFIWTGMEVMVDETINEPKSMYL